MEKDRRLVRMALALGALVLVLLVLAALALHDIYHDRESDLVMEWNVVRVAFLLMLMYVGLSGGAIWRLLQQQRNR